MRLVLCAALISGASCSEGPPEVGSGSAATTPLTLWWNEVNVETTDNNVEKPSVGPTAWNAGAASVFQLTADGYVEFTTAENTTDKVAGLGPGTANTHYADMGFAIRLNANGVGAVYESGVHMGGLGAYSPGDRFRIQVRDRVVTYWRNGVRLRTSGRAANLPLRFDVALRTPGATIRDATIDSLVFWTTVVGAHAVETDLEKTDTTAGWNAGAVSRDEITADGFVEFSSAESDAGKVAGLGSGNASARLADVEFSVHLKATGRFAVLESGTSRGTFGAYAPGDVFRVAVDHGVVTYARNQAVFYTSQLAPSLPLRLDTSLSDPGATITDARVAPCVAETATLWPVDDFVAIDAAADLLLVGNPGGFFEPTPDKTAVYRRSPDGWALEQTLATGIGAGRNVATDGTTLAIGGGSLQMFRHDGTAWVREGNFLSCAGGSSVAVQGNRVVAGAATESGGAVHVYRRTPVRWRLEAVLAAPAGVEFFGSRVAIGGDRIFVGASGDDGAAGDGGAIHVFRRNDAVPDPGWPSCTAPHAGRWEPEAVLYAPGAQVQDWFGGSGLDVSSTGTLLVAGNPQEGTVEEDGVPGSNGSGQVVAFRNDGAGWQQVALFTPSQGGPGSMFGRSLALGGPDPAAPSLLVVSATSEVVTEDDEVYVYRLESGAWREIGRIVPPPGQQPFLREEHGVAATADEVLLAYDQSHVSVQDLCPP